MIAQARITSDTQATIYLSAQTVEIIGADLPDVRSQVKRVFINEARRLGDSIDVVIVEPDVRHHLRVETTGRISSRPEDQRPWFGPSAQQGEERELLSADVQSPSAGAQPLSTDSSAQLAGQTQSDPAEESTRPRPAADANSAPFGTDEPNATGAEVDDLSDTVRRSDAAGISGIDATAGRHRGAPVDDAHTGAGDLPAGANSGSPAPTLSPDPLSQSPAAAGGSQAAPALPNADQDELDPSAPTPVSAPSQVSTPAQGAVLPPVPMAPSAVTSPATTAQMPPTASSQSAHPAASPSRAPQQASPANPGWAAVDNFATGAAYAGDPSQAVPVHDAYPGASPDAVPGAAPISAVPSAEAAVAERRPTLADLQAGKEEPKEAAGTRGFPGFVNRFSGGLITLGPNRGERAERDRTARIRKNIDGPRNVVVVNLKGGAHKTTASLMLAATLGVARGGSVLAWDNNETRGTLGWRGIPTDQRATALDLLNNLSQLRSRQASVAELDQFVRPQGDMRFDILASDEDPGSAALIDGAAFDALNDTLSRFYRIKVIDTGNNVRASNWLAAVRSADQLVIISTVREDTFNAAAWMIDELRATGLAEQVDNAVTVLSHSAKGKMDPVLRQRLLTHFGSHTRAVAEVPYEESFVDGGHMDWSRIHPRTKQAWQEATAIVVDGL